MGFPYEAYQKFIPGVTASGLSAAANRFTFVKFGATEGTVVPLTADTEDACGVLQMEAVDGAPAQVCYEGFTKVQRGAGAVAYGAEIGASAAGQALT